MIRLKGDKVVNQALDSRLERESQWVKKSSTVVRADSIFQKVINNQNITLPTFDSESEKKKKYN